MSASDAAIGGFALALHDHAGDIAMLLFSVGALLWYSLFVRTRFVPRWLSVWGLASVVPVCLATLLYLWDRDLQPPILLYVAYMPLELVVGLWLLVKGSPVRPDATTPAPLTSTERPTTPDAIGVRAAETTPA